MRVLWGCAFALSASLSVCSMPSCAATCRKDLEARVWMDCLVRYGPSKYCAVIGADLHCPEHKDEVEKRVGWIP